MRITIPMYEKGRSFILAGGLLRAYQGHYFVYLHLLCQGFENIGKAMLLAKDFECYAPLLKPKFGHNLETILDEINILYGSNFFSTEACLEIREINRFYMRHQFRYGDKIDFSDSCSNVQIRYLHRELVSQLDFLNEMFGKNNQIP